MKFHIYDNVNTYEYTQEWLLQVGFSAIVYYSYNKIDEAAATYKMLDIMNAMKFLCGIYDMSSTPPKAALIWEDSF